MKKEFVFEIKRKFVHSLSLLFVIVYYLLVTYDEKRTGLLFLVFILCCFLVIDYFRIVKKKRIPVFGTLWRKKEHDRLGGNVFLIIGLIVAFSVFDFDIALAGLLMAMLGDMSAAIVGVGFGKHRLIGKKTWEGTIAELIVNLVICFVLIDNLVLIFAMVFVAILVETTLSDVDDNLAIPLFSGFVGQLLRFFV